jgi:hypothetical protein
VNLVVARQGYDAVAATTRGPERAESVPGRSAAEAVEAWRPGEGAEARRAHDGHAHSHTQSHSQPIVASKIRFTIEGR